MIEILNGTRETVSYLEHFGIRLYLNQEAEDYPVHWHTAGEIIMPIDNIYTVIVNDTKHVLNPGEILVLPSGELHQLFAPESGERIILQFDCSLLYNLTGFDSAFHLFHPCIVITKESSEELHRLLKNILLNLKKEYFSKSLLKEASAYSMLIQFFVILGRNCMKGENRFPGTKSQKQHEYIDKFLQVCNYMNEHCTEDIKVEDLAAMAGFSKFHFTRLFKQFTGMSYYSYLNKHRIMHAERLLIDPNLSVTEVAMRSGFISLATFNRVFKTYKRCTPTEYKCLHGTHSVMVSHFKNEAKQQL
ncbi:AraC family transcriptional regulator [Anaerocolumna cellulosilytica]|uniref:AraC family transcriptional regulator n=1 Tax=Anaerocolumna cellulosilytica TaxID=433286 RepID=A0A6S6R5N0_9FIRM|nr:AraC family transcriptional regulator [Anaerocolumna cellulosilytica]MBB5194680.1 AraC-like DNA-binding protein [Anaerocolumna cellulosilytica]BCJ94358.1 AraC family transcriptional regulator [Anaerocolumna cellulosilytica]